MKTNKFLVSLLLLIPSASFANFCSTGNPLAKTWRDQQNWIQQTLSPSRGNPVLQFSTYKDTQGQIYVQPFNIKGAYRGEMAMKLASPYGKASFVDICKGDEGNRWRLSYARQHHDSDNQFRVGIDYLPSPNLSLKSPYLNQSFRTDNIGVRIYLKSGSLVEKSVPFFGSKDGEVESIQNTLRDRLNAQLQSGVTGHVELQLDGLDDVACDWMSGRLEIEFFHNATFMNPIVDIKNAVREQDVQLIYSDLQNVVSKMNSKEEVAFAAGSTWRFREMAGDVELADETKAFQVITQLFQPGMGVLKNLPSEELACLAANESEFSQSKKISSVVLRVNTNSILEMAQ
jgi:hypothetical protein